MKNTLILGGSGLVGSAFSTGIKLGKSQVDLRNPKEVDELFRFYNPDSIIHAAAKVGGIGANINSNGEFFHDNVLINLNVIEFCKKHNIENLVCFSSTCIFPDKVEYPLTPDKIHLGEPHSSNYGYAYSKRMMHVQLQTYREQYGLEYVSVIPCNIYGPNDNFSLEYGHVIPSLIHKCYLAKNNNTDLKIWGSGEPLREFIYSKDVAFITELILENYKGSTPVILSPSQEISIKDIIKLIVEIMEFEGKVVFDLTKSDGQYRKPSSNELLKELLPDFKFTPIEVGLKETIGWFIKNYDFNNIRK